MQIFRGVLLVAVLSCTVFVYAQSEHPPGGHAFATGESHPFGAELSMEERIHNAMTLPRHGAFSFHIACFLAALISVSSSFHSQTPQPPLV